jgi:hypothetical protein
MILVLLFCLFIFLFFLICGGFTFRIGPIVANLTGYVLNVGMCTYATLLFLNFSSCRCVLLKIFFVDCTLLSYINIDQLKADFLAIDLL